MYDISIDEARAQIWIRDVQSVVDDVESVLKDARTAMNGDAFEGDTIMTGLQKVADKADEVWSTMCKKFKESSGLLQSAIDRIRKPVEGLLEDIEHKGNNYQ